MELKVDGNASLQEQEDTLNFAEKGAPLKLVSYDRGTPHENIAKFEPRDQAVALPLLKLSEGSGKDIWVGGVIKKVAVSRA